MQVCAAEPSPIHPTEEREWNLNLFQSRPLRLAITLIYAAPFVQTPK